MTGSLQKINKNMFIYIIDIQLSHRYILNQKQVPSFFSSLVSETLLTTGLVTLEKNLME